MNGKKKMCLIVKSEEYYGISLWVDKNFDEDYNSPMMEKIVRDFPKSKRKVIIPRYDEVDIQNEGKMKNIPKYYLTSRGVVKSVPK